MDLTYLTSEELEQLKERGTLEGPLHSERINIGRDENYQMVFALLDALGIKRFKPHNRLKRKMDKKAKKFGSDFVYCDYSSFGTLEEVSFRGTAEFYRSA